MGSVKLPPIILASASPRRLELLRQVCQDFQVIPSNADETEHGALSPGEMSKINAYRKARAISKTHPDALVIGMDTVVALDDAIFNKPSNLDDAKRMLQCLQGRTHIVVTGVCLVHLRQRRLRLFSEVTHVTFKPLTAAHIAAYYKEVNPLDKAGGYAIQESGDQIVEKVDGSFSNVVGLPLERLRRELEFFQ